MAKKEEEPCSTCDLNIFPNYPDFSGTRSITSRQQHCDINFSCPNSNCICKFISHYLPIISSKFHGGSKLKTRENDFVIHTNKPMIDIDGDIKCLCFVCLFVRVLHANVMQSIMSHCSQPTNGPLLTDTYEFGNVISFSHNFAATFYQFSISYAIASRFFLFKV